MKPFSLIAAASLALVQAHAANAQTPPAIASLTPERCAALASFTLTSSAIGLPTGGARVTEAKSVPATVSVLAHCLVSGEIAPVDPAAPPIRFQVALPLSWNGKILGVGGGGFNGSVPPTTSVAWAGSPTAASPLARGYAIFGSDSGHKTNPLAPGDFMGNPEALRNYLGDALKKTHDTGIAVVTAAFSQKPTRAYFVGGSTGGREALWVAGRWPQDWDGIVSLFPARDLTTQVLGTLAISRAYAEPGAFVPPAKRALLLDAVLEACDGMDGLKDGLISDMAGCNARFVPARATYRGKPLRCTDGMDSGEDCLSDKQLGALAVMQGARRIPFKLASGVNEFPGYNAYTSDLGIKTGMTPADQALLYFGLGTVAPAYPVKPGMSLHVAYGDNFVRHGWVQDAGFNSMALDPAAPGKFAERISELSRVDSSDSDLSPFAGRGGKMLVVHGTADMIVSARTTERYYARLQKKMGRRKVDGFLRFYEVPGYSHGVSNTFNLGWDFLSALENWAERGKDPAESEVATDLSGVPGRTRPLCRYPRWPQYKGSGDANSAASFRCASN